MGFRVRGSIPILAQDLIFAGARDLCTCIAFLLRGQVNDGFMKAVVAQAFALAYAWQGRLDGMEVPPLAASTGVVPECIQRFG